MDDGRCGAESPRFEEKMDLGRRGMPVPNLYRIRYLCVLDAGHMGDHRALHHDRWSSLSELEEPEEREAYDEARGSLAGGGDDE
jgi:hypothetical protein